MTEKRTNQGNSKNRIETKKGFTLVELIVVLTIMSILAGLVVFGILGWQDFVDFRRQNEYAQTLFVAAQNQLTEYSENGQLTELQDNISNASGNYSHEFSSDMLSSMTDSEGKALSKSKIWPESNKTNTSTNAGRYQGAICYITVTKADYALYKSGNLNDKEKQALYDMLSSYIYDPTLMNAAISVEFSPEDGQVYSVLYSDKDDEFVYDASKSAMDEKRGTVSIVDRQRAYRKERMIGYYGVDTLSKATNVSVQKPSIANVKLNNEDTLNLSFKLSKVPAATQDMTYEIKVINAKTKDANGLMTITLDGTKIETKEAVQKSNKKISCSVSIGSNTIDSVSICAWVETDNTVRIILDAADLAATSNLYKKEYSDIKAYTHGTNTTNPAATAAAGAPSFINTFSFHRFGLSENEDNIYCSIKGSGALYKTTAEKESNTENAFFASKTEATTTSGTVSTVTETTYGIKNCRHLYNMRYIEDYSDNERVRDNAGLATTGSIVYELQSDMDWDNFVTGMQLYESGNIKATNTAPAQALANGDQIAETTANTKVNFPSIAQLRKDSTLKSTTGKNYTINHMWLSYNANVEAWLYNNSVVKRAIGVETVDENDLKCPVGLILVNNGSITDVTLDNTVAEGEEYVAGFCGLNGMSGACENLIYNNTEKISSVTGTSNVGGIIGGEAVVTNTDIAASHSKEINVGTTDFTESQIMKNLENNAVVQGTAYVGGIIGQMRSYLKTDIQIPIEQDGTVKETKTVSLKSVASIEGCKNYGIAKAFVKDSDITNGDTSKTWTSLELQNAKAIKAQYIGGIIGYAENTVTKTEGNAVVIDSEAFKIENCNSSPEYTSDNLTSIFAQINTSDTDESVTDLTKEMTGVYVGGIVGYNKYASVVGCSTKKRNNQEGYVFGYQYVGGIIGFNETTSGDIQGTTTDAGTDTYGYNEANVIGNKYVGGIIGCNAAIKTKQTTDNLGTTKTEPDLDNNNLLQPDTTRELGIKISRWINKGAVVSRDSYVGGITGYNTGYIFDCNSEVSNDAATQQVTKATTLKGSYAGGIAGYNNGVIGNTERNTQGNKVDSSKTGKTLSAVAYITGKDYVGGIVGYNDVDAIVEDYKLSGGYILGTGCFAGGYAGLNASEDLLMDKESPAASTEYGNYKGRELDVNPNEVTGAYCVGGSIGANIINATGNIHTYFKTDNFLGNITATAITGGYIGYNHLINVTGTTATDTTGDVQKAIEAYAIQLGNAFHGKNNVNASDVKILDEQVLNILTNVEANLGNVNTNTTTNKKSDYKLTVTGITDSTATQTKFGSITADIYVGGVMGYNNSGTHLLIKKVTNMTPVKATKAVTNDLEQISKTTYQDETFQYSYVGGIIGKVTRNTVIDECKNQDVGDVTSKGTYLGGICEINEGTIQKCSVSSIGLSNHDYVGGIAGLNKEGAFIQNTTFGTTNGSKRTVTGKNFVGGLVSENYGTVSDVSVENGAIKGTGARGKIGGVVGQNYATGTVTLSGNIDISIKSDGKCVGGVVGYNEGILNTDQTDNESEKKIKGSITGDEYVGGIVGKNDVSAGTGTTDATLASKNISGFSNEATILAVNGNAGGIAGATTGNILNCMNAGAISATKSGDAGGIVANIHAGASVKNCGDNNTVSATNGNCGGITATNSGTIENCQTTLPDPSLVEIWWNNFTNWIKNLFSGEKQSIAINEELAFFGMDNVGGICAVNNVGATITNSYAVNLTVSNTSKSGSSNIGAITGDNKGTITGGQANKISSCKVLSYTSGSNIGGVAGKNTGTISNMTIDVNGSNKADTQIGFTGNSATYANMGGIAGSNGTSNSASGSITGCSVTADITGNMGSTNTGYGGISGVNYGTISSSNYSGIFYTNGSADNVVNLGGITGKNMTGASVNRCFIASDKATILTTGRDNTTAAMGYVGGMVGWNYGTVSECDNKTNSRYSTQIINYAGDTGGIVGYQMAGATVTGSAGNGLSTGETWSVQTKSYSNDSGTGGIMGYSASGMNLSYVSNYASVGFSGDSTVNNVAIGGMVGRLENRESNSMTVDHFTNYGTVSGPMGKALAGGLIGRIKYKGISCSNIKNYGNISGSSAAGLIATLYEMDENSSVLFDTCENYGNISGATVTAGIKGATDSTKYITTTFTNCMNEGEINGSSGSIAGISGSSTKETASFYRCRNYGNSTSTSFAGIVTGSYTKMVDCLTLGIGGSGSSAVKQLTSSSGSGLSNSFYLGEGTDPSDPEDSSISLAESSPITYNSVASVTGPENLYTTDLSQGRISSRYVLDFKSTTNAKWFQANFYQAYDMQNFGIYWANNGSANNVRKYTFKLSANDGSYYMNKNGEWSSTDSDAYEFTAFGTDDPKNSYWSAQFKQRSISNIKIEITSVRNGNISNSKFNDLGGLDSQYVCLYNLTASNLDTDETTLEQIITKENAVDEAQTAVGNAQVAVNEAQDAVNSAKANVEKVYTDSSKDFSAKADETFYQNWSIDYVGSEISNTNGSVANLYSNLRTFALSSGEEKWQRVAFMNRKNSGSANGMTFTLTPPNTESGKISGVQILWAAGSDDATNTIIRDYSYNATITYTDGTSKSVDRSGSDFAHGSYLTYDRIGTQIGNTNTNYPTYDVINDVDSSKTVANIVITMKSAKDGNTAKNYACFWSIGFIKPGVNTDKYTGYMGTYNKAIQDANAVLAATNTTLTEETAKLTAAQESLTAAQEELSNAAYCPGVYNEPVLQKHVTASTGTGTTTDSKYGTKVGSSVDDTGVGMYKISGSNMSIKGLIVNPISLWNDKTSIYNKSNTEPSYEGNGFRQRVRDDVDPKMIEYYKKSTTPAAPSNIQITENGNSFKVTWGHNGDIYYEDQLCYVVKSADGTVLDKGTVKAPQIIGYGAQVFNLDIDSSWQGGTIEVFVRSDNGRCDMTNYDTTGESYYPTNASPATQENASIWVSSNEKTIRLPEPVPKVHIELGAKDATNNMNAERYVAILDNPEDFTGGKATSITVKIGSTTVTIAANKNCSDPVSLGSYNSNALITVYANANSTYTQSLTTTTQSSTYGETSLKNTDYISTTFNDFFGNNYGNLYNQIKMNNKSSQTEMYVNSEIVLRNYTLGDNASGESVSCDIAVASGNSHVTQVGTVMTSNLDNIPSDFLKKDSEVVVRTYPWQSQAYMFWFGHAVTFSKTDSVTGTTEEVTEVSSDELISAITDTKNGNSTGNSILKDSARNDETIFVKDENGNVAVKTGYTIQLQSNGNYKILYSVFLANPGNDAYEKQIDSKTYNVIEESDSSGSGSLKVTDSNGYKKNVQPKPVIKTMKDDTTPYVPLQSDGKSYQFIWDEAAADESASYEVKFIGIASGDTTGATGQSDTEVLLKDVTINKTTVDDKEKSAYVTDGGTNYWQYTFVDTDSSWNYSNVKIEVTRIGTTEDNTDTGKTKIFPSYDEHTFKVLLRYSQMTRPTVSIGSAQKNSLLYDINWDVVSEISERKTNAFDDFSMYDVMVTRSGDDENSSDTSATITCADAEEFINKLGSENELYTGKAGGASNVTGTDITQDSGSRTYTWQNRAADQTVITSFEMNLTWDRSVLKIEKNLTEHWYFEQESDKTASGDIIQEMTKQILLDEFERGELLEISVKALAKDDASTYRDSSDGVARELTLPKRLDTPSIDNMYVDTEYGRTSFMTLDEVASDGLTFTMKDNASDAIQAKYEIAIAVYDENEDTDAGDEKVKHGGDAPTQEGADTSGYWNSGAIETICFKEPHTVQSGNGETTIPVVTMTGDLSSATYTWKDYSDQYAGKWLKIAVRSISDSNISSWWTDEDEAGKSMNYKWIQIPRIQIETTDMNMDTNVEYYNGADGYAWVPKPDSILTDYWPVTQKMMTFTSQKNANSYTLEVIHASKDAVEVSDGYVTYYVDWIYMIKDSNDNYDVFYQSTQPGYNDITGYPKQGITLDDVDNTKVPENTLDTNSVYLGQLTSDQSYKELPRIEQQTLTDNDASDIINPVSYLQLIRQDGKEDSFKLILPDTTAIDKTPSGNSGIFTTQVREQAVVTTDELQKAYEDSILSNWYRDGSETIGYTDEKTLQDAREDAPELQEFQGSQDLSKSKKVKITASAKTDRDYDLTATVDSSSGDWIVFQMKDSTGIVYTVSAPGNGTSTIDVDLPIVLADYGWSVGQTIQFRYCGIDEIATGKTATNLTKWSAGWNDPDDPWDTFIIPDLYSSKTPQQQDEVLPANALPNEATTENPSQSSTDNTSNDTTGTSTTNAGETTEPNNTDNTTVSSESASGGTINTKDVSGSAAEKQTSHTKNSSAAKENSAAIEGIYEDVK